MESSAKLENINGRSRVYLFELGLVSRSNENKNRKEGRIMLVLY